MIGKRSHRENLILNLVILDIIGVINQINQNIKEEMKRIKEINNNLVYLKTMMK